MRLRSPPPARPGEVNYHFVDRFTLAHASIGVAYALLGLGFYAALALAVLWELVENPLKAYVPRLFPHATKDTLRNAVGDTLAVLAGWGVTRWLT
jgi:hypothetical protein